MFVFYHKTAQISSVVFVFFIFFHNLPCFDNNYAWAQLNLNRIYYIENIYKEMDKVEQYAKQLAK